MINEFFSIYEGLKGAGEEPQIKHNDIASPGMGTTFRVCLSESGTVNSIELLTKEKIKNTWSLGNGNKNQFPAIKYEYPFIPSGHEYYKEWKKDNKNAKPGAYYNLIKEIISMHKVSIPNVDQWPSYRSKILERKKQLKEVLKMCEEGLFVFELFERYSKAENEGISIIEQVGKKLVELVSEVRDRDTLRSVAEALFGEAIDNKGRLKDSCKITLLLDCLPQKDIDIHVSSRSRIPVLSEALFAAEQGKKSTVGNCALTGRESELFQEKFPSEKLSVVGNTILFSKNDGTSGPTVRRYGKAGVDSFSLSKLLGEKLAAGVVFLTTEDFEGKTWKKIPSSVGTSPSLLLAYCKSNFDLAIAPVITGGDIDDFDDYANATESVLRLFDKSDCSPDDVVEICEIRVLDKANRKVNYSNTATIGKINDAATDWIKACNNVPDFKLFARAGKENKLLPPWVIAPIETIFLTKNKFIRNGLTPTPEKPVGFSDTMTLFLSQSSSAKNLAYRNIEKISNQVEPLFKYCALSKVKSRIDKKVTKVDKNALVLKLVTLFGVLLFKFGRMKEVYMSNFAYQFGQLCSAMDELHIGYCQSMRSGDIPNTLIGNTTYSLALQNPKKALEVLASRIRPYKAWANKEIAKTKDLDNVSDIAIKAGLFAHLWIKKQAKLINDHFDNESPQVDDTYKAELMLGYLAGRSVG